MYDSIFPLPYYDCHKKGVKGVAACLAGIFSTLLVQCVQQSTEPCTVQVQRQVSIAAGCSWASSMFYVFAKRSHCTVHPACLLPGKQGQQGNITWGENAIRARDFSMNSMN